MRAFSFLAKALYLFYRGRLKTTCSAAG